MDVLNKESSKILSSSSKQVSQAIKLKAIPQLRFKSLSNQASVNNNPVNNDLSEYQKEKIQNQVIGMLDTKIEQEKNPVQKKELEFQKLLMQGGKPLKTNTLEKLEHVKSVKPSFKALQPWQKALGIVQVHSGISAGIAGSMAQVPFADAPFFLANDAAMMGFIGHLYDMEATGVEFMKCAGALAASQGGQSLFKAALGWFPAAGNMLNAGIAVSVTEALGTAFTGFCELAKRDGHRPNLRNFSRENFGAYTGAVHSLQRRG